MKKGLLIALTTMFALTSLTSCQSEEEKKIINSLTHCKSDNLNVDYYYYLYEETDKINYEFSYNKYKDNKFYLEYTEKKHTGLIFNGVDTKTNLTYYWQWDNFKVGSGNINVTTEKNANTTTKNCNVSNFVFKEDFPNIFTYDTTIKGYQIYSSYFTKLFQFCIDYLHSVDESIELK